MSCGRAILKVLCVACILQVLLTIYLILKIYISSVTRPDQVVESDYIINNDLLDDSVPSKLKHVDIFGDSDPKENFDDIIGSQRIILSKPEKKTIIEIWGKAAISSYLWEHILGATKKVNKWNPSIYIGELLMSHCIFKYQEGPGLQPESANSSADKIVLVSNGRTLDKVKETSKWLKYLSNILNPPKVLMVMLGNEKCDNQWVLEYIYPKGAVRGIFITYDDTSIDSDTFFQWPLGVATYRNFPNLREDQVALSKPRELVCNLQATNYVNTSRNKLFQLVKLAQGCQIVERKMWESSESVESMNKYVNILIQSDLTLCPAGFNTETYRVFEALATGSVPVIEDTPSTGLCDQGSGWRLLKQFNAPVIWIKTWDELPALLQKEKKLRLGQKIERRKRLFSWYEWFKFRNKDRFLSVVENKLVKPD